MVYPRSGVSPHLLAFPELQNQLKNQFINFNQNIFNNPIGLFHRVISKLKCHSGVLNSSNPELPVDGQRHKAHTTPQINQSPFKGSISNGARNSNRASIWFFNWNLHTLQNSTTIFS